MPENSQKSIFKNICLNKNKILYQIFSIKTVKKIYFKIIVQCIWGTVLRIDLFGATALKVNVFLQKNWTYRRPDNSLLSVRHARQSKLQEAYRWIATDRSIIHCFSKPRSIRDTIHKSMSKLSVYKDTIDLPRYHLFCSIGTFYMYTNRERFSFRDRFTDRSAERSRPGRII